MAAIETTEVDLTTAIANALPHSLDLASLNKTKELPDDKKTYDGFKGLNTPVPDISSLKFIKGEAPEDLSTGPVVIMTWAKYGQLRLGITRHATTTPLSRHQAHHSLLLLHHH